MRNACFTNALHASRWPLRRRYVHPGFQRLSTNSASKPALFRLLDDGTEQPITEEDLFRYQRHRWLRNERKELNLRYRAFNLEALINRAIQARKDRTSEKRCVKVLKLVEGDHNKVFLLTMNDGDELIAKLPNATAGGSFYTTASEIATRKFIKSICDVPMPQIYDWDLRFGNPVGTEWIIEAKAAGQPLRSLWFAVDRQTQQKIVRQIVDLEAELASVKFSTHGSIYMSRWLKPKHTVFTRMDESFIVEDKLKLKRQLKELFGNYAIGPSVDRKLYRGPRDMSNQFRGPFPDILDYATTLGNNELKYISHNFWRRPNAPLLSPGPPDIDPYKDLIEKYFAYVSYWAGSGLNDDPCTISHPSLNLDNIFIDPETHKIVCITGWQATVISPPVLKRPFPRFLDLEFQTESRTRNEPPPRDYYRELVEKSDPLRYKRVLSDLTGHELRTAPISAITGAWEKDGMYSLLETLLALGRSWERGNSNTRGKDNHLPDWAQFDKMTLYNHSKEKFSRLELEMLFSVVQDVRNNLKIPMDGRVRAEDFEHARQISETYRQQYIRLADEDPSQMHLYESLWPFDSPDKNKKDPGSPKVMRASRRRG